MTTLRPATNPTIMQNTPPQPPAWKEQTAVVTGGADGLGFAVARGSAALGGRISARGVRIVLLDFNQPALERAQAELGAGTLAVQADVTDHAAVRRAIDGAAAQTGITVNALAPAVIFTDLVAKMPPEQVKYMTDKIPMGRCGTKEEVAAITEFIVSPENSFTTAFAFDMSGGRATY
jgi:NAD(P)-dependent dehydrogenase (short-subunit alcohol dehydrogenase family)